MTFTIPSPFRANRSTGAFTLVEVLVSATLTVGLALMLLTLLSGSSTLWRRAEDRAETFNEARTALEMMKQDLSTIVAAPNAPMLMLDYAPDTSDDDKFNEELYLTTTARNDGQSDLCSVGYFCKWNGTNAYVLKRRFRSSDTTFAAFNTASNAGGPPRTTLTFADLYGGGAAPAVVTEDIATYIWDLHFTAFHDGQERAYQTPPSYSSRLPRWVEVRFKALGAGAARKLSALSVNEGTWQQKDSAVYQNAILPNEQEFALRINLSAPH